MPQVTALYAGILGLMAMALATGPGPMRGKLGISVGDGGNKDLLLAMRRHANFLEWVPLILILLAMLEIGGVGTTSVHVMGAALVLFRVCHAFGLKADTVQGLGRFVGAAGSAVLLVVVSIWNIVLYVQSV